MPSLCASVSCLPRKLEVWKWKEHLPQDRGALGKMIPEWGSGEPPGFPTTLEAPAPEKVAHPSQSSRGDHSWRSGCQQPNSSPARERRAPSTGRWGRGLRRSTRPLIPPWELSPGLCGRGLPPRVPSWSSRLEFGPWASPSPAAQSLKSPRTLPPPRPRDEQESLVGSHVAMNIFASHPNSERPPSGRGVRAPGPLRSSPALAFLCAVAGCPGWAGHAELAPLAGSPPRPRPVLAR